MRLLSILTALIISTGLYFLVFERAAVKAISNGAPLTTLFKGLANDETAMVKPDNKEEETNKDRWPPVDNAVRVVALKSVEQIIDTAVILRGQTEAARQVQVRAETSGQVVSEPLRKGTSVRKNQILCKLDPGTRQSILADANAKLVEAKARVPENQARLEEAESRVKEAKINFNAARQLALDGYATDTRVAATLAAVRSTEAGVVSALAEFKATRSRIQSAASAVAVAEKEIERLILRAPFAGLLESDTTEIGSLLQSGAICATVIQLNPIKFVGYVSEIDMPRIKIGASAKAKLLSGHTVYGKVTFLSRSADQLTRTFRVDVETLNNDLLISDGQTADIMISADGKKAHLVPQSALTLNGDGDLGIRIVTKQKKAQFKKIKVLSDSINGVWLSGLPKRANIIIVGQEYVKDGVLVDPKFKELSK